MRCLFALQHVAASTNEHKGPQPSDAADKSVAVVTGLAIFLFVRIQRKLSPDCSNLASMSPSISVADRPPKGLHEGQPEG